MKAYRVIITVNGVFAGDSVEDARRLALAQVNEADLLSSVRVEGVWDLETGNWVSK
jgi:hypothetical protein